MKLRSISASRWRHLALAALAACDPKPQPPKASALPSLQAIA